MYSTEKISISSLHCFNLLNYMQVIKFKKIAKNTELLKSIPMTFKCLQGKLSLTTTNMYHML